MKKFLSKPVVLASLLALLVAGGVFAAKTVLENDTPNTTSQEPLIKDDVTSGGNATKNADPQTETTVTDSTGTLKISQTFQDDNGDFVVQTQIYGTSTGNCKLKLSKGSTTINKSAGVLYQSSFSTCKGFSIPLSEFPTGGAWQLKLTLEVNNAEVAAVSQEVAITK